MNEHKYMWNHAGTALLISIWSDSSVQKQLRATLRNQPIWDGVARCMMRKGFRVNGKQCRTRIKNILVRYREVKKTGNFNGSGIESFYNDVDRVMTARNLQASTGTSSRGGPSTDPLGLVEQKYSNQHSKEFIKQEMVQVNIKAEQNSPPTISDDSVQELQDFSQDSTNQQQFFHAVDVMLDDDQSSSSIHMTSSTARRSPLSLLQSDDTTVAQDNEIHLVQDNGHPSLQRSSLHSGSHSRNGARLTNQYSRRSTMLRLERLVMRAIRAQSDAVTKILNVQSELFTRMVEADRERQARIETKLDRLIERLDQSLSSVSAPTAANKSVEINREQDAQMNQLLNRLDWAITPSVRPTAVSRQLEISNRIQETKLDSLLDKLDRLLPALNPQALKGQHTREQLPEQI
ncbi:uncharacterized protein LOC110837226 isoform X2 [Zootermopsis nevadensis]|uniref:Zinc finger and SCAN domain-containing protein 20 n=1 Tax=Zootermopsis nevadensis TaxID=136037 RepID=A0A067QNW6_ZOONE|nr:uncharacterized protein LOC110837226 isoform X2 [Zootermopsis nevadensis]KDR11244.1 Zinc finger and SCAN domain-containing protein 20 [Zootermopsis nevadensis]